jgi:thiamine phosphate synthase YjbQ (UPF0047 family)
LHDVPKFNSLAASCRPPAPETDSVQRLDLPAILDRLIPPSHEYGHEQAWHDGNGHSHLQATLLGQGLTVRIGAGQRRHGRRAERVTPETTQPVDTSAGCIDWYL